MNEYMVTVKFLMAFQEEFTSLIPSQRNEVNRLIEEGVLTGYCLSSDRETLWMMLRAASTDAVHTMLEAMPLYKFMRFEITELMFHVHPVSLPMHFSMN